MFVPFLILFLQLGDNLLTTGGARLFSFYRFQLPFSNRSSYSLLIYKYNVIFCCVVTDSQFLLINTTPLLLFIIHGVELMSIIINWLRIVVWFSRSYLLCYGKRCAFIFGCLAQTNPLLGCLCSGLEVRVVGLGLYGVLSSRRFLCFNINLVVVALNFIFYIFKSFVCQLPSFFFLFTFLF